MFPRRQSRLIPGLLRARVCCFGVIVGGKGAEPVTPPEGLYRRPIRTAPDGRLYEDTYKVRSEPNRPKKASPCRSIFNPPASRLSSSRSNPSNQIVKTICFFRACSELVETANCCTTFFGLSIYVAAHFTRSIKSIERPANQEPTHRPNRW